ncbi:MAG: SGNH/GDSL hydrolase family protein [Halioglobus sp.]
MNVFSMKTASKALARQPTRAGTIVEYSDLKSRSLILLFLLFCVLVLSACSVNTAAPDSGNSDSTSKLWQVHCESSLKPLPKKGQSSKTSTPKGWIAARTPAGHKIELKGRLDAGFVQVTDVVTEDRSWTLDAKQPYVHLRKVCRQTMAKRKQGMQFRPGLVRTSKSETGVYTSFVFDDWAEREPAMRVVVFGDSLSDTGKLRRRLQIAPRQPYWLGRFANGPVWVDYLEVSTGMAIQNHALGGAMAAHRVRMSNEELAQRVVTSGQFLVTGSITHQIDDYAQNYLKDKQGQQQDSTIGILWAGANDYISKEAFSESISALLSEPASDGGYDLVVARVIAALEEHVLRLHALGLKRLLVINLPDLGVTPMVLHNSSFESDAENLSEDARRLLFSARLNELTRAHNIALEEMVSSVRQASPDLEIAVADSATLLNRALDPDLNGDSMDFDLASNRVTLSDEATQTSFQDRCYSGMTLGILAPSASVCANPPRAVFWDLVHPSTYLHCWMAYAFGDLLHAKGWVGAMPDVTEHRAWCERIADAY